MAGRCRRSALLPSRKRERRPLPGPGKRLGSIGPAVAHASGSDGTATRRACRPEIRWCGTGRAATVRFPPAALPEVLHAPPPVAPALVLFAAAGGSPPPNPAEAPWPAPVKGFVAPKAGSTRGSSSARPNFPTSGSAPRHRRGRPSSSAFASCSTARTARRCRPSSTNRARAYEGKTKEPPVGKTYTLWHGAGYGMLYQLTGEKKYADLGKECVEKALAGQRDRDDRYSWAKPGGALRAGPSLGAIAMAYDLGYDGWDEDFRKKVAGEIQGYNQGQYMSPRRDGPRQPADPRQQPLGLPDRRGGAGGARHRGRPRHRLKVLAGHREAVEKNIVRQVTEGFGDHGYFHEHPGPGQIASDTAFVPLLQAMRVAGGKDFVTPRPNAEWISLKWALWLLPTDKGAYYPNPHPETATAPSTSSAAGLSKGGQFAQGFGAVDPKHVTAMLWVYKHFVEPTETKEYPDQLKEGERSFRRPHLPAPGRARARQLAHRRRSEEPRGLVPQGRRRRQDGLARLPQPLEGRGRHDRRRADGGAQRRPGDGPRLGAGAAVEVRPVAKGEDRAPRGAARRLRGRHRDRHLPRGGLLRRVRRGRGRRAGPGPASPSRR